MYTVQKSFKADGEVLETGEKVDADDFRNLEKLIEYRYLSPPALEDMTHDELYKLAQKEDIKGRSGMDKPQLIEVLQEVS